MEKEDFARRPQGGSNAKPFAFRRKETEFTFVKEAEGSGLDRKVQKDKETSRGDNSGLPFEEDDCTNW
jgi:hypothetical protein